MGRRAKLKRRRRGRFDARIETLCRFTRTTDSTATAVGLALGAVNFVAAYLDPPLAEAAADVVALIEDLLDSRRLDALDVVESHRLDSRRVEGLASRRVDPLDRVDVLFEGTRVLRWPARAMLERVLDRVERAVATASATSGPVERPLRAGRVVLHAAQAALDAEAGEFALASEHAGDAVQMSLALVSKRGLRQLFEVLLPPDPALSELLADEGFCHTTSCCPCC